MHDLHITGYLTLILTLNLLNRDLALIFLSFDIIKKLIPNLN